MKRMIYISSARPDADDETLTEIAKTSIANNSRDGLTGILIWVNDAFLQVLEGPEDALNATLLRIRNDPRHSSVTRLSYASITERLFPDWAMGYHAMNAKELPEALVPRPDTGSVFRQLTAAPDAELSIFLKNFYAINDPKRRVRVR